MSFSSGTARAGNKNEILMDLRPNTDNLTLIKGTVYVNKNQRVFAQNAAEGATGNANLKIGGVQLNSGSRITGYSDTITSTSNTLGATVGGVKKAHDAGTRQATESTRGTG